MTKEEILKTEKDIEQRNIEVEENNRVKASLQTEEKDIAENHAGLKTEDDELDREQSELRNKREILSEELHSSDIKLNEMRMKCENIIEHIKEY